MLCVSYFWYFKIPGVKSYKIWKEKELISCVRSKREVENFHPTLLPVPQDEWGGPTFRARQVGWVSRAWKERKGLSKACEAPKGLGTVVTWDTGSLPHRRSSSVSGEADACPLSLAARIAQGQMGKVKYTASCMVCREQTLTLSSCQHVMDTLTSSSHTKPSDFMRENTYF